MKSIHFSLFLGLCFFVLNLRAQRIGFSSDQWKTLKTEHFDIVFIAEQHDLGLYYAQVAEKAYQNLQTIFTAKPERTVLVINDSTDSSNGFATRLPYPTIMAFPVQINDHESLSEAGEWARELITHEMTHILQFEPALGFYKYLRPIFGSIVAPNLLLPVWWKEGMAVEMETQFSPRGRLRSNYQDATLRAMVLDKKLFTYSLAAANEVLPSWPFDSRPYLFGSVFWSQLSKDKGIAAADYITQRHGERVPYFVEAPMRELTDEVYETQYTKALYEIADNAQMQIEHLKKILPSSFDLVKIAGQTAQQPIYSKAHKLLAFIESVDGVPEITILNPDLSVVHNLKNRPTGHIDHIIFHPTLKQIYFTKIDRLNSQQTFSDLYMYDLESGKTKRITREQRLREPCFSDDGKKIIFISTFDGKTQIKILDLENQAVEVILDSKFEERFVSPIFWGTDSALVTKKNSDGIQALIKVDLKTKSMAVVNLKYKNISFLKKYGPRLYFISSENGVQNIYFSENLQSAVPVTHSLTGVWSYSLKEDQSHFWATTMTSDGFGVAAGQLEYFKNKLPVITNKIAERYHYVDHTIATKTEPIEDYAASPYLWPHYWTPFVSTTNTSNGLFIQAQTAGQDPLQIHRYSLLANYQTDINRFGYLAIYTNSAFKIPFQMGSLQTNQSFGTIDQVVQTKTNYLAFAPDVFAIQKNLSFQIGIQDQQTSFNDTATEHLGIFTQLTYADYVKTIFQISAEYGWGTSLRYEKNNNVSGSQDYDRAIATVIGFSNWGLPQHHVLVTRLNALVTFESVFARFGTSNASVFTAEDSLIPQFVLRGYPASQFYGRSLWTANTEYRFPVTNLQGGSGTNAFFAKRLSGAIIADGLGVEGRGITLDKIYLPRSLNESIWSAGIEARLETTVGYILPMNFVLGAYLPFSSQYASSPQIGLSLQLGGF